MARTCLVKAGRTSHRRWLKRRQIWMASNRRRFGGVPPGGRVQQRNALPRFGTSICHRKQADRNPKWIYAKRSGRVRSAGKHHALHGSRLPPGHQFTGTYTRRQTLPQVPGRSVLINPTNAYILYAGTDVGIFASDDTGRTLVIADGWTCQRLPRSGRYFLGGRRQCRHLRPSRLIEVPSSLQPWVAPTDLCALLGRSGQAGPSGIVPWAGRRWHSSRGVNITVRVRRLRPSGTLYVTGGAIIEPAAGSIQHLRAGRLQIIQCFRSIVRDSS
jgi:hypothetical protein